MSKLSNVLPLGLAAGVASSLSIALYFTYKTLRAILAAEEIDAPHATTNDAPIYVSMLCALALLAVLYMAYRKRIKRHADANQRSYMMQVQRFTTISFVWFVLSILMPPLLICTATFSVLAINSWRFTRKDNYGNAYAAINAMLMVLGVINVALAWL